MGYGLIGTLATRLGTGDTSVPLIVEYDVNRGLNGGPFPLTAIKVMGPHVGSEIMAVSAVSDVVKTPAARFTGDPGTVETVTLTVTRAQQGTTAKAHWAGAFVFAGWGNGGGSWPSDDEAAWPRELGPYPLVP